MKDKFYCHVNNGGLTVEVEQENADRPQYLKASWDHFGNAGPVAMIPLLSVEQVDAMILLLNKAKASINVAHTYDFGKPSFKEIK